MVRQVKNLQAKPNNSIFSHRKIPAEGKIDLPQPEAAYGIAAETALLRARGNQECCWIEPPLTRRASVIQPDRHSRNAIGPLEVVESQSEQILGCQDVNRESRTRRKQG